MRKIMLLTVLLFIASIGFSKGQVQFSEIIKKIEKKFEVSITYEADISFNLSKQESNNIMKNKTVEEALNETVKNKNIAFTKISENYFVIAKKEKSKTPPSNVNNLQPKDDLIRTITGIVTDEKGETIPGVMVSIEGTTIAGITDFDGKFELKIPQGTNGFIIISNMGYKKARLEIITGVDKYDVVLIEDVFKIDEVVVSGVAGNTSTKKLTVTVEKVEESELKDVPASSAASALQGKIAGMQVKQAYGSPGSGSTIRLRGSTSLTGNQSPLIIVDGVMTQTNLADFNVDDIESVEVVKGAAAASLYGSKAGNGVIVITTKRGKNITESFSVKIRNEYGISELQKELELSTHHPYQLAADQSEYDYTKYEGVDYDEDGEIIGGSRLLTDSAYADQPYAQIRNQQQEFFKRGQYFTNYVSLAKKEKNTNMFLSFENHKNSGIVFNTDGYSRKNFRFNADTRVGKYIKISTSNMYVKAGTDDPGTSRGFSDLLFVNPDVDLTEDNADGSPYNVLPDPWSIAENALYPLYHRESNSNRNSFLSNITTKITPRNWIYFDIKYTYEKRNTQNYGFNKKGYLYMGEAYIDGLISRSTYTSNSQVFQSTANINKVFGDITVKSKLSYLLENLDYNSFSTVGHGLTVSSIHQFNNTDQKISSTNSYEGLIRSMNVFGILDADYKGKYLASGLYRYDGSSLFGSNVRWNPYYRIAGAYRISEDLKIPGVNEFKIRAALGTSGQRPGFSNQYETYYLNDGILSREQLGNKDLRPSESRELEFAVDAVFVNIFKLNVSYSKTDTKNAIGTVPLASHLGGFTRQYRNIGTISSNALELSLGVVAVRKKDIDLNFNFTYDKIKQEITELNVPEYRTGPSSAYLVSEGEPFGILYGYDWVKTLEQMSKQIPEDKVLSDYTINSDGYVILAGTEGSTTETPIMVADTAGVPKKVIIANGNPDFNLNASTRFRLYNISFYMLWSYKHGGAVYNYTRQYLLRDGRALEADQFGKAEADKKSVGYYSALYSGTNINSHFVEDGTFLKLREVSVYYNYKFKKKKSVIKSARVGIVGRNLFTLTKYTGYDPEVASGTDLTNYSFDNFGYPVFRTLTGSIEFVF